jgi:hypothetical protein
MKPGVAEAFRRRIADENKELDRASRTGEHGPEAISDLCWTLFKD